MTGVQTCALPICANYKYLHNSCRNLKYLQVFKARNIYNISAFAYRILPGLLLALLHRGVALGSFHPCGIFDNDAKLSQPACLSLSYTAVYTGHCTVVLGRLHRTIRNRLYLRGEKRCILRNVVYSLCFLTYASLTNSYSFCCLLLNGLNDLFSQRQM